jgi:hypothetical protein
VYHSVRHARSREAAFRLGLLAMTDRAKVVRYRALSLVAYSFRDDALPALAGLLGHPVRETAEDAAAAIDAIKCRNHHYFHDRTHSGTLAWNVTPDEAETWLLSRGERSPVRPGQRDPEIPAELTGPLPAATRGARR